MIDSKPYPGSVIRDAEPADVDALAALSGQLGYPVPADEMAARLRALLDDPREARVTLPRRPPHVPPGVR